MKASDCFQYFRGWLPGWRLNYSDSCRVNPRDRAGKRKFSIAPPAAIAFGFDKDLHSLEAASQTGFKTQNCKIGNELNFSSLS